MLAFSPDDPFPLAPNSSHAEARAHSAEVDAWLGLRTHEIEGALSSGYVRTRDVQPWIGLAVDSLLTPYSELREILEKLQPSGTVVDLGAGYGRMAFVLRKHFPEARFIGYELVTERVIEGNRCLGEELLISADLTLIEPAEAEIYFLYDFGTREAIEKALQDLKRIAAKRKITVVGRGRASRDAIERHHPWLSQVMTPEHFAHYSIYRS